MRSTVEIVFCVGRAGGSSFGGSTGSLASKGHATACSRREAASKAAAHCGDRREIGGKARAKNLTQEALIIRVDFDTRLIDAVSRWLPNMPPMFVANNAMPQDRERYTLTHELGHLVLHSAPHPTMEDEANRFAAEFLMPGADIKPALYDITIPKLAALKRHWKVSMAALLYRAYQLGTINERRYRFMNMQLSKAGYKTREPVETDPPREQTTLMENLLSFHMRDLSFALDELAAFLHVNVDYLLKLYEVEAPFHSGSPRPRLRAVTG